MYIIDIVVRVAFALDDAFDCYFRIAGPLAICRTLVIIKNQFNASATCWISVCRTGKNNILNGISTQRGCLGFAQHPAYCIDNIGFSTPIWTNNADQIAGDRNGSGFNKRLKTGEFNFGQTQFMNTGCSYNVRFKSVVLKTVLQSLLL